MSELARTGARGRLHPNRPPTYDEMGKYVPEFDAYAAWYPQMDGCVAKTWVLFDDNGFGEGESNNLAQLPGGCFDVLVYHDGQFPFDRGEPAVLHHCTWEQFITFGEEVRDFEKDRRT